jgi:putative hydrolase
MKDLLDVHMHTLASGHAYNTIREMIAAGKKNGMQLVGIADHAPAMPGSTHRFYFENLRIFDRKAYGDEAGVELLMGVELNILNTTGKVDLEEKALRSVDYAIASLHDPCINPGSVLDNTTAIMSAMFIPQVKIIGHPDNPTFPVDFDQIAKAAKERHVLLECNNSSYRPGLT